MAGSLLSVVLFGFFLTEPRLSFQTYAVGYPVTFAVMLASSVLTGTLASKLKDHARLSARSAFRVQVLFDTCLLYTSKSNRIKEILSSGNKIKTLIISYGLSEKEAFVAESALINIMNYIDPQSLRCV